MTNLQPAVVVRHGNPSEKEMESPVVVEQHLSQHTEAVEGAGARQEMPLGGTDGNDDQHCRDTSREAFLLMQNLDQSRCSHHAEALEVATFQHDRNSQNRLLAGTEKDSL